MKKMSLLESIGDFNGLKGLSLRQLDMLCAELRQKILEVTLKNGGHLSSSLGAVELIVALLREFNPDRDKIIFDVGHQAYAYKLLTKRLDRFDSLRSKGGLAGFPRMDESPYDFFTTGHSSTSISAAVGYAKARDLRGEKHEVIAVIGDGALINGVSFEALNCVESADTKIIIILNDNKMCINPQIGGMAKHLARLSVNPAYKRLKDFIKDQCHTMKRGETIESALSKVKSKLKSLLLPTNIFEEMDISYWGPFNGHDVKEMEDAFHLARSYDKSLLIHVITKKGKGYRETEAFPSFFHGIGPNSSLCDATRSPEPQSKPSWSAAMSGCIDEIACEDPRVIVCTAAMADGTKLNGFSKKFPDRFFDVGISEEHLMIYAAGIAAGGMRPVVCIYSTFLQRAIDQVTHDICLPKLPVLIGIDRAGFVGEDGETHHGLFDLAWLRTIPEITIAAPRDVADLDFFVRGWLEREIPMAIRYPRGAARLSLAREGRGKVPAEWGKLEILRQGKRVCLIGVGSTTELMLDAAQLIKDRQSTDVTVADLRFIKPLDYDALAPLITSHDIVVTAEESYLAGGVGEAIAKFAKDIGHSGRVINIGAPDIFVRHATRKEQWAECGMTPENIAELCAGDKINEA